LSIIVALLVVAVAGAALVWRPAIAAIDPPAPPSFDPALVRRGGQLAAMGNCASCHTLAPDAPQAVADRAGAAPGGPKAFAGGVPVPTPFGTVYSTNITPDPDTGIGRWSEQAFRRAMRDGVSRDGHHLYPTFPYDHFTHVSDADDRALYAYLMTRAPVRAEPPANRLSFPYDQRPLVAGWKLLFLHPRAVQQEAAQTAAWNRGAYLVEGLAHCGACHTPRNALGAERPQAAFAGGQSGHWQAYALTAQSPAPVPWTQEALAFYLRHGWQADHGVARGPMAEVTANLATVDEADVAAIAAYTAALFGAPDPDRRAAGAAARGQAVPAPSAAAAQTAATLSLVKPASAKDGPGAAIYQAACANCHESARPLPYAGVNLHLSTGLSAPEPRNAALTILQGLAPREGERSPIMPAFAATLSDAQLAALLDYLRSRFSARPPWTDLAGQVAQARAATVQRTASDSSSPPKATAR
jgi:mono/diheme cytochrome c family protein